MKVDAKNLLAHGNVKKISGANFLENSDGSRQVKSLCRSTTEGTNLRGTEPLGGYWRRGAESNRRIKVLQTSPLPLGYRALFLRKNPQLYVIVTAWG